MLGISWLAAKPVSFWRRTLLHGVSNLSVIHNKKWNASQDVWFTYLISVAPVYTHIWWQYLQAHATCFDTYIPLLYSHTLSQKILAWCKKCPSYNMQDNFAFFLNSLQVHRAVTKNLKLLLTTFRFNNWEKGLTFNTWFKNGILKICLVETFCSCLSSKNLSIFSSLPHPKVMM